MEKFFGNILNDMISNPVIVIGAIALGILYFIIWIMEEKKKALKITAEDMQIKIEKLEKEVSILKNK